MAKATASAAPTPRLKALYLDQYRKELQAELALSNVHQVPKLEKIVVSAGIGKHKEDKRYHQLVRNTITKITGQAPVDRWLQDPRWHGCTNWRECDAARRSDVRVPRPAGQC